VSHAADAQIRHPSKDLWLVHLGSPIETITPLELNSGPLPAAGTTCVAVGFGWYTDANGVTRSGTKRSATSIVETANSKWIRVVMGTGIADRGDSGGPLLCDNKIAGVTWKHTDGKWPQHIREYYTTLDIPWLTANAELAPPPPNNSLYAVQDGHLYRIDRRLGNYELLAKDLPDTTSMTVIGRNVYLLSSAQLHKVSTVDGTATPIGGADFPGPTHMAVAAGGLFIQEGAGLWKIDDLTTGTYHRVGTKNWTGATSMTALNGKLYIIHESTLHRVEPSTGAGTTLGSSFWPGETRMTSYSSKLYIVQGGGLWVVNNLTTGGYDSLGNIDWTGVTSLTAMDSSLYLVQGNYLYKWSLDDNSYSVLGPGDWGPPIMMAPSNCGHACNEICVDTCSGLSGPALVQCISDCGVTCEATECR
jgi:hypothetical protein